MHGAAHDASDVPPSAIRKLRHEIRGKAKTEKTSSGTPHANGTAAGIKDRQQERKIKSGKNEEEAL